MNHWDPFSWKAKPAKHLPHYANAAHLEEVRNELMLLPPLVVPGEIIRLKSAIAEAGMGKNFILQGGDCAERFIDCNSHAILNKLKILLQMSVIITYGSRRSVVRVGRIAGQYAKPRSNNVEIQDGKEMFSYFGDAVNSFHPDPALREPDANRMQMAYTYSAATLNYIRSLISGGFADLHYPHHWDLYSMDKAKSWPKYQETLSRILDAIDFFESIGGARGEILDKVDFFTSHEGLLLEYEAALTRFDSDLKIFYSSSAHMLWIGDRTRQLGGAHVEFFRGIANPVGIKIGPSTDPKELVALLRVLNPEKEKGKIVLISRMGRSFVKEKLSPILETVMTSFEPVTWSCDPMHGNMIKTDQNRKTRHFDDILGEIKETFLLHRSMSSCLGGLHFELTGDDVTECLGGAADIKDTDLEQNYETYCDPRLNYTQSMEMAFLISDLVNRRQV